ncbi:DUF1146 domain-containing protein [Paenibacillus cisolokensis]|jgi:uncharacterized integral membrane protein (TIGR02327 family)|uniref:DUF1146 domain-containing protein n=1 Tax=Paenibacillus cisolokensis TaxID=1658519 RepID=A0ABQ4N1D6_9BACL|nr:MULTISPECIES: DUF1146 domain-containing protein [Paenibacillus]ALS26052.1 hypothetical protein IJ21_06200 [Paenibacillus sp. 32O-W]GIQ61980.1 hypothetical protein PACILC2_05480 [Paenibacillus cisolokensis]
MDIDRIHTLTGMTGLLSIVVVLFSIVLAWTVLQELKLDVFMRRPKGPKARILQVMLAIVLGHAFASFILDYWHWSNMLRGFVE